MELDKLDLEPFKGDLETTRKKVNDMKDIAKKFLGDNLERKEKEIAVILRDTMCSFLARLKELDPKAPELNDEMIKKIVEL